ncbi:hypothetical protein [Thauera sinica]|uniref:Peptidase M41 domain-containing protein n=1 Tax=Thauera sinica TaxID=2665146 RepID=A0ABW1AP73_9RHOO|nr:hypothetical protein [Thauera sp. K11]ATE61984.1 hypothetical protein CCZ27_20220 [Thauera sp. K11]
MRRLTAGLRRETCFHEAGHAVAFALGGIPVLKLAVAPEGADGWRTDIRTGRCCTDLWGLCEKADLVFPRPFLRWLGSEGALHPDGRGFEAVLDTPVGQAQLEGFSAAHRREIRAHAAGLLGGPVAERIHSGEKGDLHGRTDLGDVARAAALCRLLTERDAFAGALAQAEEALRRPGVWDHVARLAAVLEREGEIRDGLRTLLPAAIPHWPAAGAARRSMPPPQV